MIKPTLYYCYDAYCGWCYGFNDVMNKIEQSFNHQIHFDVLSGGMILPETPIHISATASYIAQAYQRVEQLTGVRFGEDYLWHIFNPDQSDWYPHSEMPAIALCILKDEYPDKALSFAHELQFALHGEGRDLTDPEAYRLILEKYKIPDESFYEKLKSEAYRDRAHEEFAMAKQLQVDGYPCLLLQTKPLTFHLVAKGYTPFETVRERLTKMLNEMAI